jgi:hypothetical protein
MRPRLAPECPTARSRFLAPRSTAARMPIAGRLRRQASRPKRLRTRPGTIPAGKPPATVRHDKIPRQIQAMVVLTGRERRQAENVAPSAARMPIAGHEGLTGRARRLRRYWTARTTPNASCQPPRGSRSASGAAPCTSRGGWTGIGSYTARPAAGVVRTWIVGRWTGRASRKRRLPQARIARNRPQRGSASAAAAAPRSR